MVLRSRGASIRHVEHTVRFERALWSVPGVQLWLPLLQRAEIGKCCLAVVTHFEGSQVNTFVLTEFSIASCECAIVVSNSDHL